MKDALVGTLVLIITIAVIVAGYYIGIMFTLLAATFTALGIIGFILFFVLYAVYDLFTSYGPNKRKKKTK